MTVVGTQSSGKSSLLNGIVKMLLPTGSSMVTRTPIKLMIEKTEEDFYIEFGKYIEGIWKVSKRIKLTKPYPKKHELDIVRELITEETKLAGNNKSICFDLISLKIYSPYLPNLSLIDLPGIIMTALTDKDNLKI